MTIGEIMAQIFALAGLGSNIASVQCKRSVQAADLGIAVPDIGERFICCAIRFSGCLASLCGINGFGGGVHRCLLLCQ